MGIVYRKHRYWKILQRIFDYIKSLMYYPTMKKYFDDRDMSECNTWNNDRFARFKYAWWHCHVGMLKNN